MKTLIKNGNIITATDNYVADVLIDGEQIACIGRGLTVAADRIVDAAGQYVLPGGVDVHTHLDATIGATTTIDDFESGTIAAAFGGTTTIVDYASQNRGEPLLRGLEQWQEKARGKAVIDYAFHLIVTDLSDERLPEIDDVVSEGVTSLKLFLAYPGSVMVDDGLLFKAMRRASRNHALVCVHAENGWVIDVLVKQALAENRTGPAEHGRTRPTKAESEATHRAIAIAEIAESPVYIAHLSCAESLAHVMAARDRGLPVYAETCPQYLLIDSSVYSLPGFEPAKYVFTPPAREVENQDVLWRGLATNHLQVISTDHCPFSVKGQKDLGADDFTKIPNGLPGIEHRLMLTYSKGVLEGKITLNRWVDVVSTAPARIFGMYPRKGAIAVGSDADLVVFDPHKVAVISAETHHMRADYNPYEGTRVKGVPTVVLSRGNVIVENGRFLGTPGQGRYIKRAGLNGICA